MEAIRTCRGMKTPPALVPSPALPGTMPGLHGWSPMKNRRVLVSLLGLAAVLIMVGLAALLVPVIRYRLREAELIETLQLKWPPDGRGAKDIVAKKEAAV